MSRFLFVLGFVAVTATVAQSQQPFGRPPSLRAKVGAKPFDPKAKSVKLTNEEAKALVAELTDDYPNTRLAALLRVRPGAPESVIEAVLDRLNDPYFEQQPTFDGFATDYVLRGVASECLAHLGPPASPVVLKYAQDNTKLSVRNECIRLLGRLGHTADAEKWLRELLAIDTQHARAILDAAEAWGKSGAGLPRLVLMNEKAKQLDRAFAMVILGQHGDLKEDAKILRPFLKSEIWHHRVGAVKALGNLRDRESLPVFEKMARDPKEENHIREKATEGALTMLDKAGGDKLLLDVVKTADGMFMGYVAEQVAERKLVAAAPHLLPALTDRYNHPREKADLALRALTGRPDGVGYEHQKGNAELWRAVIEKK